jgi:plastocyanin
VVYVSAGLPAGRQWPVPGEAVKLDQKGCRYIPHVVSMMVGQRLEAANSDAFLHNVHTLPAKNPETNVPQAGIDPGKPLNPVKVAERFRVKCDVHPWMSAWVVAVDHPFHSVTGEDGYFALSRLPPGKYTLTAWHETLGEQTRQVTVKQGEPVEVEFTFEKK